MKSVVAFSFALLCSISAVAQTAIKPPKEQFNSRRGLEKTTETLVHLVQIFAERQK